LQRILVFLGGSDPGNVTRIALDALSEPEFARLHVDVVLGASNAHRAVVERLASARPSTTLHFSLPDLARVMAEADLAIGAGGTTTWERMCLGLPTVLVSIAENQEPACRALADAGLAYYLGSSETVAAADLAGAMRRLRDSAAELAALSARCSGEVDGHGAQRVAEALMPSALEDVSLRPDGDGRIAFESRGLPVGSTHFEHSGEDLEIDWSVDPVFADRGWTSRLLARAVRSIGARQPLALGAHPDSAFVRRRNVRPAQHSIAILSDRDSWMNDHVSTLWAEWLSSGHRVLWVHDEAALRPASFCFLLGCGQIVPAETRARFLHTLVVHESELPEGRGWSPLTWQIVEGKSRIPVTLLEAAEKVDSGAIYAQDWLTFAGHELVDELRAAAGASALALCRRFVAEYPGSAHKGVPQQGSGSYYRRRTPADSRLAISEGLEAQLDLLRVVDNERYPAFFDSRGNRYVLAIRKVSK